MYLKTEFLLLTNILAKAISSPKPLTNKEIKLVDQLADTVRTQHDKIVLGQMAESIKSNVNDKTKVNWGWKEPNSHVIVKQLKRCLPTMKYIHVIRNGIDMAFSENQNQLIFWGKHYFKKELENTPENSLKYWCRVHKELIVNTQSMKKDFYLLNFDEFCQDPKNGLDKLSQFFEMNLDSTKVKHLISLVKPPKTIGRYKQQDISVFNTEDLAYVKHLGFDTTL